MFENKFTSLCERAEMSVITRSEHDTDGVKRTLFGNIRLCYQRLPYPELLHKQYRRKRLSGNTGNSKIFADQLPMVRPCCYRSYSVNDTIGVHLMPSFISTLWIATVTLTATLQFPTRIMLAVRRCGHHPRLPCGNLGIRAQWV